LFDKQVVVKEEPCFFRLYRERSKGIGTEVQQMSVALQCGKWGIAVKSMGHSARGYFLGEITITTNFKNLPITAEFKEKQDSSLCHLYLTSCI
jgi:hypothetical protein